MKINEAIKLHNERQRARNIVSGRNETDGFIKKSHLAGLIWPKQQNPRARMSNLISGKSKMFKVLWVWTICKLTGVDANFLFRQSSKHDEDYNKLIKYFSTFFFILLFYMVN